MAKFEEASRRLFKNVFVCKRCKSKIRAQPMKILQGEIRCRRCDKTSFRAIKKVAKK